jgi:hypothetical protein
VRPRSRELLGRPALVHAPAWLLAFSVVLVLGADSGGYWPTSWGWTALVLSLAGALALVLRADLRLGALELAMPLVLLGFVAWGVLSELWSPSLTQPVLQGQRTLVYVAGVLAALLLTRSRAGAPTLLAGVWCAVALVCGYSLLTRLVPDRLGYVDTLATYRLSQPLGYWNALGIFAAIGTLLALGFAARGRHPAVRAFAAASIVPLVSTLYFTFSRGAWIALGLGLLATLALDRRRLQLVSVLLAVAPWPAIAVWRASGSEALTHMGTGLAAAAHAGHRFLLVELLLALAAAGSALVVTALERRLRPPRPLRLAYASAILLVVAAALAAGVVRFGSPETVARHLYRNFVGPGVTLENGNLNQRLFNLSGGQRIPQWKVAWREYEAHPWLGSGSGTYERYWNQLRPADWKVRNAHSLYLETLAELGPVGLALLVVALSLPLAAARRARRHSFFAAAATGAYVAFLAHAAVDWDWQIPAVTLAAFFCGAGLLVCTREAKERLAGPGRARWRTPILVLMIALAGWAFVGLRGSRAIAASESAATKLHWTRSAAEARTATRWAAWSSYPWQLLGEAQFQQGKLEAARKSFRKALAKDGGDWSIWLDLAVASKGEHRRRALAQARRLNPLGSEVAAYSTAAGARG